uniref:Transposon protein, putative, CACTA, En/Spm sub-class n=1 Tax=Oryza sativa subsp. japonica TaxID=39947 RepID=H2KWK8_ORYSJ|nr:transposon protein, putative, CACTA, En/Spm sub-class [Oryza sativa Japonica Group]
MSSYFQTTQPFSRTYKIGKPKGGGDGQGAASLKPAIVPALTIRVYGKSRRPRRSASLQSDIEQPNTRTLNPHQCTSLVSCKLEHQKCLPKICFSRTRKFLSEDRFYRYRENQEVYLILSIFPNNAKGKHFEHKADHRTKPKHRSGKIVFAMVKDLKVVFGMGPGSQPIESEDGHAAMWKKNSIFWELPYWEFLDVRYAIDVMHITKNLCVNLLGLLGVYGKSKDTLEALIIRGILPDNIRATITKLCAFMNAISQKIGILGPVYLNNMFPFERYMGVLKKYVHNRACPEASIAKGYGTEKVIEFCVEFIEDLRPIGVSESRHEGILWGKGTFGRKAIMTVDNNLFRKAHFTVLQQSSLVAPYIEEHLALVHARNISKSDAWITRHQIDTFPAWLRQHLMGNEAIN